MVERAKTTQRPSGEIAGAVQRGAHEFRPHLAVAGGKRDIGHPGRGDLSLAGLRTSENAQAVAARTIGAADEAAGKGVLGEADKVA